MRKNYCTVFLSTGVARNFDWRGAK